MRPHSSGVSTTMEAVNRTVARWFRKIPTWIIARVAPELNWVRMRKRMIAPTPETVRSHAEGWLDLERAAVVEVTSEETDFPVEAALVSEETPGCRAASAGAQTIRLIFDQPQPLRNVSLCLRKNKQHALRSLSCDGPRELEARFEKLCGSNGTSAHRIQCARSRNTRLNSRMSGYWN
jgi:hypothetical protein